MSLARGLLVLALALARLSAGVEVELDGVCELGDNMCHPSPKALIQMNSRVTRNLAVIDSERSSAISTAHEIENHTQVDRETEYQDLAKQCCWTVMKPFVIKVVQEKNFAVCDEGGLIGLLWWYDCDDDHQTYDNLVKAIERHGPDATTGHKGTCPFIGWEGCRDFPKDRTCDVYPGPLPECKEATTTLSTTESTTLSTTESTTLSTTESTTLSTTESTTLSTTSTTSMCRTEVSWDHENFGACDFYGDPHFKATFVEGRFANEDGPRLDIQNNGIFELASANDGSFKMQTFNCHVENQVAAVAVAFVFELDGKKYFVHDQAVDIDGVPQNFADELIDKKGGYRVMSENECVRLEMGTKKRRGNNPTPPYAQRLALRLDKKIIANDGLCEVENAAWVPVADGGMFSADQIETVCEVCTLKTPAICPGAVLLQSNVSSRSRVSKTRASRQGPETALKIAEDACFNANPRIEFSVAEGLCSDALDIIACITDFCSTNGDEAMIEIAVEEKTRFLVGCKSPGGSCESQGDCCDGMLCSNATCKYRKLATCSQPLSPPHSKVSCIYSEEACRTAARIRGLKLGGNNHEFAGDYGTKGCYTYDTGEYVGKAFYGLLDGGDVTIEADLGELTKAGQTRVDTCTQEICVLGRAYATNRSSADKRCSTEFKMTNDELGKKYWEVDDLDECANVCDTVRGCVSFDFKSVKGSTIADPSKKKHRCTLCQEMPEGCPTLVDTESTGQVLYYHLTSSGCMGCKYSGDYCSVQQDCCGGMICEHSVCKDPKVLTCSHKKENADTCVTGHAYATNSSSEGKRCNMQYVIPSTTADYHEVDDLDGCADLCDTTQGCIAFDMKDRLQPSQADSSIKKYRCSLCKEIDEGCPTVKTGQYNHYHLTYSGCNGVPVP